MGNANTTYLWDLADTLFGERWDFARTGFKNYDAYIESLGFDLKTIDAKTYEWNYEQPFKDGRLELTLQPGFTEILTWTKNNSVFTTGNKEQIGWRTEVFLKKYNVGINRFFEKIYSTFDYGNTNKKTEVMFEDILRQELRRGRNTIVYSDNLLENCKNFMGATGQVSGIGIRAYHINAAAEKTNKLADNFFEVPGLLDILQNEKTFFN